MSQQHFTTKKVAEMFATDEHQVRKWIRQGRLGALNLGSAGRPNYRISEGHIAEFETRTAVSAA